MKSNTESII